MNADVTDRTTPAAAIRVDRRAIDRLAARGLVSAAARDHALGLIEPPRRWGVWAARLVTVVGAALVLAGIVHFFAYNWNHIPPPAKLGGIAAMIATAVAIVGFAGFGGLVGEVAASAAVMLVGVFMAVEGQIHQTGADAWQLFAGWAALTVVWALLANSAAVWAIWLAVANVAAITWWDQVNPSFSTHQSTRYLLPLVIDGGFLLAREILAGRGVVWVAARWTRFYLLLPTVAAATFAAIAVIDRPRGLGTPQAATAALVMLTFAVLVPLHRRWYGDVAALAVTTIGVAVVAVFAVFQLLTGGGRADLGVFFVMGLVTLGVFAAAIAWLRAVARSMEA
ncbi:MAG: DUF2157 domain-containing protein [Siculibacillus sp.]|nr:DUF2157 domain-containing protein [Siculibacillus sp.]